MTTKKKEYGMSIPKRTQFNYTPNKLPGAGGESLTEPGQVSSIEEIVARATRGEHVIHDDRLKWDDMNEMMPRIKDLTDLDTITEKLASLADMIEQKKKIIAEKRSEEEKQKIREELEKELKSQENASDDPTE
jgi:predicted transcriptional regulator